MSLLAETPEFRDPELPLQPFDRARQNFLDQFSQWLDRATPEDALDEFQSTVGALNGLLQLRFMV
jgi:hypothetical protein